MNWSPCIKFQPRQNLLNAASRVGEASTSVLYTIGEETEQDKETQVTDRKKSFLYRKLNYCYDNFYRVFFSDKEKEYDTNFDNVKYDDDGIYEDIDTRHWNGLDVIQEESDSDYYRSLDYCNAFFRPGKPVTIDDINQSRLKDDSPGKGSDYEAILNNCEGYLDGDKDVNVLENVEAVEDVNESPKLYPKTVSDKIYNFKKDFSNHDYVNVNFDRVKNDVRSKNELLREQFFADVDSKNKINEQINKQNGAKIECHSIRNDVTRKGPDVRVSGSLNMKLLNNLDKYNRVLTTTETFMEKAEASFTKNEINKRVKDDFETFIKKSEKYYTTESKDRKTTVEPSNADQKGKTEIRIFYNPTFRNVGNGFMKGFCQYCNRKCPRTDEKCCPKCVCLELELKTIWKENWLNILLFLALIVVFFAVLVQCFVSKDVCEKGTQEDGKCFEMV